MVEGVWLSKLGCMAFPQDLTTHLFCDPGKGTSSEPLGLFLREMGRLSPLQPNLQSWKDQMRQRGSKCSQGIRQTYVACDNWSPDRTLREGADSSLHCSPRQSGLIGCMSFGVKSLLTPDKVSPREASGRIIPSMSGLAPPELFVWKPLGGASDSPASRPE